MLHSILLGALKLYVNNEPLSRPLVRADISHSCHVCKLGIKLPVVPVSADRAPRAPPNRELAKRTMISLCCRFVDHNWKWKLHNNSDILSMLFTPIASIDESGIQEFRMHMHFLASSVSGRGG